MRKRHIEIKNIPIPTLGKDEVMVKVMVRCTDLCKYTKLIGARICGTDLHNDLDGGVGDRPVREPLVIGHEYAGEVIAYGSGVTSHQIGDRVAGECPRVPLYVHILDE